MHRTLLAAALTLSFLGCASPSGDDATEYGAQGASCTPYVAGTRYAAGALVTAGGKGYECKPWPYSGWCSLGGAYAPGAGFAWRDAWSETAACGSSSSSGGSGGTGSSGATTPKPADACKASAWAAGTNYRTGDVVSYGGNYYVATHDNPGYDPTISTWFWSRTTCAAAPTTPPPATGPAPSGTSGFERILSRAQFEAMFPARNGFYTYDGLVEATKKYPAFAATGSAAAQKREVAAFLANVNHETGSLVYVEEIAKGDYTAWSDSCAPASGKRYYGRGPIQLSWNYNYCSASQSIFGDKNVLRLDPDRVARESWVAWATGLWFWMSSTGAGSMTAHDAIAYDRGFGETIRTINGSLECGGRNPTQVASRVDAYKRFCALLGVDPAGNLGC